MNIQKFLIIDLNLFSLLLMIVLIITITVRERGLSTSAFLFIIMCSATSVNLLLEVLKWYFEEMPGTTGKYGAYYSNFFFLMFNPIPTIAWLNYIDYLFYGSVDRLHRRLFYLPGLVFCVLLMTVFIHTDFVFRINDINGFERGPGMFLILIVNYLLVFIALIIAIKRRNSVERRFMSSIVLFVLLPAAGGVFQMLFYGITTIWSLTAVGVLISYLFIEIKKENRDYLTGLLTRQRIDELILIRMRAYGRKGGFALVMIDMDGFKAINDTFGHDAGDQALVSMAYCLTRTVKRSDYVARFGGDEFLLLLETCQEEIVISVLTRLGERLETENRISERPYNLEYSSGYSIYDPESYKNFGELFRAADAMMYESKAVNSKQVK